MVTFIRTLIPFIVPWFHNIGTKINAIVFFSCIYKYQCHSLQYIVNFMKMGGMTFFNHSMPIA